MHTRSCRLMLAIACFASGAFAVPAPAADLPPLRASSWPYFTADLSTRVDSLARSTLVVAITVAHTEMTWNRLPRGFGAGLGYSVVFEPERKGLRFHGDAWERRIVLADYAATRNPGYNVIESREFDLPPGRYRVRVRVHDLSSELGSEAVERIEVSDFARLPIAFADLQVGTLDSLGMFAANPTRRFGTDADRLAFRATLVDRRPGPWPRDYRFGWRISGEGLSGAQVGDTLLSLASSGLATVVRTGGRSLFIGRYLLEASVEDGKDKVRMERSFEVEESGAPQGRDYEIMLEALSYVTTEAELEDLRTASEVDREAAWEAFWRRRDPTPETEVNEFQIEFFRRLRHAERQFQGFGPGWRSDMGRIYIKFGPPDQIEQQPGAPPDRPQIEIWYYNQPRFRRFVFVDREGFGRFVLNQPSME